MIIESPTACPCVSMTGRKRDICQGVAGLPLETVNAYRERWGLPPLDELPERTTIVREPKPLKPSGCRTCGGGPRKKPNLLQRAMNMAKAIARHIADDSAPTPVEALAFRESRCAGCPLNIGNRCKACGCWLQPNALNQGKLRWRSEACPAGKWHRHNETYRPLVDPIRNLIFHVYPLKGAEFNWHFHLSKIREHAGLFNGKIVLAVVTGPNLSPVPEVQRLMDGINVEWIVRENTKEAETVTAVDLLRAVKTDNPNSVVFRFHTKGVTHRRDGVEQAWARMIWETCTDIDAVQDALASHLVCGPLRSQTPLVRRKPGCFFFAGSGYWMRCKEVFERDWTYTEPNRWWIEYFPSHLFSLAESACLCHDFTDSSVLSEEYWNSAVSDDWLLWKQARQLV